MKKNKKCYILIHGVNTDDEEAKKHEANFREVLHDIRDNESSVFSISYGYFPIYLLLFPIVSEIAHLPLINIVKNRFEEIYKNYKDITIIAHSNGTHVAMRAIEKANVSGFKLCLFGGTIKCKYDFNQIVGKVKSVYNFCSTKDRLIRFAKIVGRGNSGYYGFRYKDGRKAVTKNGPEVVWSVRGLLVVNFHDNSVGHCDWISSPKYIKDFFRISEIHKKT